MAIRQVKTDSRLLGTWRSDKARTTEKWGFKKGARLSPKQKNDFFNLFGDLTWRFTRTRRYSMCDEYEQFNKYEILAVDDSSVVLRFFEDVCSQDDRETFESLGASELLSDGYLQQVFFDGDEHIYVQSNGNVEYFTRIE